jgi:hypothetical protein
MLAVMNFDDIKKSELELAEKHIVVLLLVKPSDYEAHSMIDQFNFLHFDSGKYCSIYAAGYSAFGFPDKYSDVNQVTTVNNKIWYYSDHCFVEFKNSLQDRLASWKYCGEPEIIIFQTDPESSIVLNFQNYVHIDLYYGVKNGYIDSFPRFMTALIDAAKSEVTSIDAVRRVQNNKYSIKRIAEAAIESSKKIPAPVKKIIKDRLFYISSIRKAASK